MSESQSSSATPSSKNGQPSAWVLNGNITNSLVSEYDKAEPIVRNVMETFAVLHGLIQENINDHIAIQPVEAAHPRSNAERQRVKLLVGNAMEELVHLCDKQHCPDNSAHLRSKKAAKERELAAQPQRFLSFSSLPPSSQPGIPEPSNKDANWFFSSESNLRPSQQTLLRGMRWRVVLGCISRNCVKWREEITRSRGEYSDLRTRIIGPPSINPFRNAESNDPVQYASMSTLLPSEEHSSPDDKDKKKEKRSGGFFSDPVRVQKEIHHDIVRTYPEISFFQREDVRKAMQSILYIYAMLNPHLQYVQGMNEILAPLLFVLAQDAEFVERMVSGCRENGIPLGGADVKIMIDGELKAVKQDELWSILQFAARTEDMEADAYALFNAVMDIIGDWFISPKAEEPRRGRRRPGGASTITSDSLDLNPKDDDAPSNAICRVEEVKIVAKCLEIQKLLLAKDYELAVYLQQLDIQPQLYMLRWVRILLSQVFPLHDLLLIWDAVFATGAPFLLVDHLCVTMLSLVRSSILGKDYSSVLSVLFHYPSSDNSPTLLVSIALNSLRSSINPFFTRNTLQFPLNLKTPPLFPIYQMHPTVTQHAAAPVQSKEARSLGDFLMSTFSRTTHSPQPQKEQQKKERKEREELKKEQKEREEQQKKEQKEREEQQKKEQKEREEQQKKERKEREEQQKKERKEREEQQKKEQKERKEREEQQKKEQKEREDQQKREQKEREEQQKKEQKDREEQQKRQPEKDAPSSPQSVNNTRSPMESTSPTRILFGRYTPSSQMGNHRRREQDLNSDTALLDSALTSNVFVSERLERLAFMINNTLEMKSKHANESGTGDSSNPSAGANGADGESNIEELLQVALLEINSIRSILPTSRATLQSLKKTTL